MHLLDATRPSDLNSLGGFDAAFGRGGGLPIAVFDFDGVLCDPIEDRVFRLAEMPGEREQLAEPASRCCLDADLYDVPYLRHLLLQSILATIGSPPAPGPLVGLAEELSHARRPFFILTARSGVAAVQRMLTFMQSHRLAPQEIFCVGRVAKGRQLGLIRKTVSGPSPIVYFDDSLRHVRNSFAQDVHGLETVHVGWPDEGEAAARKLWEWALDADRARSGRKAA